MKFFLCMLPFAIAPSMAFSFDDQAIIAKCDGEWGTDFQMVKYCRDQQRKAGSQADAIRERAKTIQSVQTILEHCESEWGTDYTMLVYCHEQQVSALSSFSNKPADVPQSIYDLIGRQCEGEWSTDYVMVAYCIDQQTAAWKELQ